MPTVVNERITAGCALYLQGIYASRSLVTSLCPERRHRRRAGVSGLVFLMATAVGGSGGTTSGYRSTRRSRPPASNPISTPRVFVWLASTTLTAKRPVPFPTPSRSFDKPLRRKLPAVRCQSSPCEWNARMIRKERYILR